VILQRALAVISAALLVTAVAIATFGPRSVSLGQALLLLDQDMMDKLLAWSNRVLGSRVWEVVIQPLLVRPAWMIPAATGIICIGFSVSLSNRKSASQSHRRS
jgi:hypothetical protein